MSKNPKRSVAHNELTSTQLPHLRIQIDSSLKYSGNLNSTVMDTTTLDNYYFVDKNSANQIQRVLYFQFEGVLPNSNHQFDYPNMQAIQLSHQAFQYDGGVRMYTQSKIDNQPDDSDVRQTVDFLKDQAAHFCEGHYYGMLRFAQILDVSQQNDLLIIYLERLQEADIPDDIIAKSRYSEEWSAYCKQLLARAMRTFSICDDES